VQNDATSLLILLDRHLGNFLVASPILTHWARTRPGTRSMIDARHNELAQRIPDFPNRIALYHDAGSPVAQLVGFGHLLRTARAQHAETVAEFGGSNTGALVGGLSGGTTRICRERAPYSRLYNRHASRGQPGSHRIQTYAALATAAGILKGWGNPCVQSNAQDNADLQRRNLPTDRPLACLHVAGGKDYKHWPLDRFATLADHLSDAGLQPALIGSAPDRPAVDRVLELSRSGPLDLAGKLPLGELIALLEQARLFIGNDSGPMHLAAAAGAHVVALFGPTDPARWGPLTDRLTLVRGTEPLSPDLGKKTFADGRRMDSIRVNDVLKAIEPLLISNSPPSAHNAV
jgi:heptosyltransferase-3